MAFEDGIFVTFYDHPVEDERESKKRGYPVFNTVVMIEKRIPNQTDYQPRPMRDEDKTDFPLSWQAYVTGKEPAETGLPVNEWPQVTTSEVALLNAVNVKTVEQLADLADSGLHRLGPGGANLKKRAQKFLEKATENDALRGRIQELERKIASLTDDGPKKAPAAKKKRKRLKVSTA